VVWKGPLKEDDLKSQVDLVAELHGRKGVSGIALAAAERYGACSTG